MWAWCVKFVISQQQTSCGHVYLKHWPFKISNSSFIPLKSFQRCFQIFYKCNFNRKKLSFIYGFLGFLSPKQNIQIAILHKLFISGGWEHGVLSLRTSRLGKLPSAVRLRACWKNIVFHIAFVSPSRTQAVPLPLRLLTECPGYLPCAHLRSEEHCHFNNRLNTGSDYSRGSR